MARELNPDWMQGLINFRVPREIQIEFKEVAKKQGKTISSLGREVVIQYLEHHRFEQDPQE